MKGIILAGGTGSRLYPLTKGINKHLLPVGNKPMIFYAIEKLVEANLKDIMVVTGAEHAGSVINYLGSGKSFGCSINYAVQDEPGGIAQALRLTKSFVGMDQMCVILGDNIFEEPLDKHVAKFEDLEYGGLILLKSVKDPQRFGVAEIDYLGRIVKIVEKPVEPKSNMAVTGIYFYDSRVFDMIDSLKPSARGELEITDVNNMYLEWKSLYYEKLTGWWTDCGCFASLKQAQALVSSIFDDPPCTISDVQFTTFSGGSVSTWFCIKCNKVWPNQYGNCPDCGCAGVGKI